MTKLALWVHIGILQILGGQLSIVEMLNTDKSTQKHNNSTISADMDTNSKNMTGKSSNMNAISNLEDIEELQEEIWSKSSKIDTSVIPRSRMRTGDSAYESIEDLSNLEGKYVFRNEVKDKKNVLSQDGIRIPGEDWQKPSDNINTDLQNENKSLIEDIKNKDEELKSLLKDNNTLKEKCKSLELNLEVVNMQLSINIRASDTIESNKVELGVDKELLQNEKEALTKERNKLSENLKIMKRDFVQKEAELESKNNENDYLSKDVEKANEELLRERTEKLSIERERSKANELFNKKIENLLIEKQQLIASQELVKKDAERLVMEKEQELTKDVKSLEPFLAEAFNYNEQLRSQIKSLEE